MRIPPRPAEIVETKVANSVEVSKADEAAVAKIPESRESAESLPVVARALGAESRPSTAAVTRATGRGLAQAQLRTLGDERPFGAFYTRGNAVAEWVDLNVGNRDGILDVNDLQKYAQRYGNDPSHHENIRHLALHLGIITVQVGNQISLMQAGQMQIQIGNVQVHTQTRQTNKQEPRYEPPVARTPPRSERDRLLENFVFINGVSSSAAQVVFDSLRACPVEYLRWLKREGYSITVARDITDVRPDLRHERPRGFAPFQTWANAAGLHSRSARQIIVTVDAYGRLRNGNAVMHEIGHALEEGMYNNARNDSDFQRARLRDLQSIRNNGHDYLLQSGEGGTSETFAESCAWYFNNEDQMRRSYPNLHAYWRRLTGQV